MSVHVTEHAVDRYLERIAPIGRDQARALMQSAERIIQSAAAMGVHTVRLGNGAKLVLRGGGAGEDPADGPSSPTAARGRVRVITVLTRDQINGADFPQTGPVCCGLCGLRCGHPISNACTRADCGLGAQRRCANDQPRRKS